VAFQNASDGSVVLVMVNSKSEARRVSVMQGETRFEYTMPPQSVATFVWNPEQVGKPVDTTSSSLIRSLLTKSSLINSWLAKKAPGTPATSGTVGARKVME
jgi:glucosylceramidase